MAQGEGVGVDDHRAAQRCGASVNLQLLDEALELRVFRADFAGRAGEWAGFTQRRERILQRALARRPRWTAHLRQGRQPFEDLSRDQLLPLVRHVPEVEEELAVRRAPREVGDERMR